jgi:hypothetical protein
MAVNHELYTPFGGSSVGMEALRDALVERVPYAVASAAQAASLDLTGIDVLALVLGTDLFWYDATDTTTVHDGATCLVTSDGKRFKNDGTRVNGFPGYAVDDDDLTAPPGSPAIGDSYLLPAAPTGAWSAYGKHIAVYTQRDWVYIAPRTGMLVYVDDEDIYRRYNGTAWVAGFGAAGVADGALTPQKMEQALGWRVESELSAQPGSVPAAGTLYIVGASATGADWSGEDGNVARSTGSGWEFITAVEGMHLFNKATDQFVTFKSGSWGVAFNPGSIVYRSGKFERTTTFIPASNGTFLDFIDLGSYTAVNAANRLVVHGVLHRVRYNPSGDEDFFVGLFFDSETSSRDEVELSVTGGGFSGGLAFWLETDFPDGGAHTIKLKVNVDSTDVLINGARAILEEAVK